MKQHVMGLSAGSGISPLNVHLGAPTLILN